MGDYVAHGRTRRATGGERRQGPTIVTVNWFRRSDASHWPGSVRHAVLKWIVDRVEGKASGTEHVFGVSPRYEDMEWNGLDFSRAKFDAITAINLDDWSSEIRSHTDLFAKLAGRLPHQLEDTKCNFARRLGE